MKPQFTRVVALMLSEDELQELALVAVDVTCPQIKVALAHKIKESLERFSEPQTRIAHPANERTVHVAEPGR